MDILTRRERSARMRLIRSRGTKPEKRVGAALRRAGFSFRKYGKSLPGTPDLVFPAQCKVIFVHGCFWHSHRCQRPSRKPKSNRAYWLPKLTMNRLRDARNRRQLRAMGWRSLTIWECETRSVDKVVGKVVRFLTA